MGFMVRANSAHMAYIKGKCILYEDADSPTNLTDQDNSQVIKEHRISLIWEGSRAKETKR